MVSMDLSKIRFARDAMAEMKHLERETNAALEPSIKDVSLVVEVYRLFVDFIQSRGKLMDANNRKKFLFVAVYLFCPSVLIGHTMPRGFRDRIKELINAKSATTVSNDVANLLFLYNHYKDFKDDVDNAYSHVVEGMRLSI